MSQLLRIDILDLLYDNKLKPKWFGFSAIEKRVQSRQLVDKRLSKRTMAFVDYLKDPADPKKDTPPSAVIVLVRAIAVGRSNDADIILDDTRISRMHCTIFKSPENKWFITDLGSSNGTLIFRKGAKEIDVKEQTDKTVELKNQDLLKLGPMTLLKITIF